MSVHGVGREILTRIDRNPCAFSGFLLASAMNWIIWLVLEPLGGVLVMVDLVWPFQKHAIT